MATKTVTDLEGAASVVKDVPETAPSSVVTKGRIEDSEDLIRSVTNKSGLGSVISPVSSSFLGFNFFGTGTPAIANNEQQGLTFFTRPLLNLSYDNIIQDRSMALLLSKDEKSIPRAIRAYLDPIGMAGYTETIGLNPKTFKGFPCPLIDNKCAFIPLLSNTLLSMSGWPDPVVDTYTSKQGMYKEEFCMADGFSKIYQSYDLSANFRNVVGDPVSYLFNIWTQYMTLVKEGVLNPRPDMVVENSLDYNTRIYRFLLDPTRTFVVKAGACGAAFPTTNSIGSHFNFNADRPFNRDTDQLSISFKAVGAMYYDQIVLWEFNRVVEIFNPDIDGNNPKSDRRLSTHKKVTANLRPLFNFQGYPRINIETSELEWWVPNAVWNDVLHLTDKTGQVEV